MLLLNDLLDSLGELPERTRVGTLVHVRLHFWQQVVIIFLDLLLVHLSIRQLIRQNFQALYFGTLLILLVVRLLELCQALMDLGLVVNGRWTLGKQGSLILKLLLSNAIDACSHLLVRKLGVVDLENAFVLLDGRLRRALPVHLQVAFAVQFGGHVVVNFVEVVEIH